MQVLQIIHGPQGYQATPQLVRTTHLFGNQQIQISTPAKPNKQPPQILPKPPLQQTTNVNQQKQRVATTVTNQVNMIEIVQVELAEIIFTFNVFSLCAPGHTTVATSDCFSRSSTKSFYSYDSNCSRSFVEPGQF